MTEKRSVNRRDILRAAGAAATAGALGGQAMAENSKADGDQPEVRHGRINQSIVYWCFKEYWSIEQTAKLAGALGVKSIELIDPKYWPLLKKHNLQCAIAGSHSFKVGFNNPENWDECIAKIKERIDAAAAFGCRNVISFTGYANGISPEDGASNCVAGYKKVIGYAEQKGVNLCLEMLNTRDSTHPMKGHPGYQGDHTDYCIDIIRRVGSPRMKLLFDIYHVQIMDGDVIRRIKAIHEYIGHVHTAGNPGRAELDAKQEINYPAIMQALLDVKYKGFVGQEFIPTRDPIAGLTEAVTLCDI